jgi:hypothetical protein
MVLVAPGVDPVELVVARKGFPEGDIVSVGTGEVGNEPPVVDRLLDTGDEGLIVLTPISGGVV